MKMFSKLLLFSMLLLAACSGRPRDMRTDADSGPPSAREVSYTIREGESWRTVSENFFGDDRNIRRIAKDNGADASVPPGVGDEVTVRIFENEVDLVRSVAEARGPYNTGVRKMQEDGEEQAALDAFELALRKAPQFIDARYNMGLVLIRLERPDEARQHLEKVVSARSDDPDALYALAAAHFHLGSYPSAEALLGRCLELTPEFLRARWTRALALQRMGKTTEAGNEWRAYLDRDATSAWADQAREHLRELGS